MLKIWDERGWTPPWQLTLFQPVHMGADYTQYLRYMPPPDFQTFLRSCVIEWNWLHVPLCPLRNLRIHRRSENSNSAGTKAGDWVRSIFSMVRRVASLCTSCTAKLSSAIYPPRSVRSFDGSDGVFEPNELRGGGGDRAAWGAAARRSWSAMGDRRQHWRFGPVLHPCWLAGGQAGKLASEGRVSHFRLFVKRSFPSSVVRITH